MAQQRGPHHSKKCPFHITPNQSLSAEKSVARCVKCVICNNQRLQGMKADLHQIAHLTIVENSPKYDPEHESGASFSTFIRSRVCATLWNESEKLLRWIPFPVVDGIGETQEFAANPLVDGLVADACQCGSVDEQVIRCVEVEQFKRLLPQFLAALSDKERRALKLRFFEGLKGVEIAEILGVTKGRVSQLIHTAFAKLKKAYSNFSQQLSEEKHATAEPPRVIKERGSLTECQHISNNSTGGNIMFSLHCFKRLKTMLVITLSAMLIGVMGVYDS